LEEGDPKGGKEEKEGWGERGGKDNNMIMRK